MNPEILRRRLEENKKAKEQFLVGDCVNVDELCALMQALGQELSEYFADAAEFLNRSIDAGMSVLFEGAQGTLLDVDHGTYPFVTASNSSAGGACTGTGVGPTRINGVVGISKAYATRVGSGPFPTELRDAVGERMRQRGQEYGASTGRPRRCGWFDAVVVRYSRLINNLDSLVLTKIDVLDELPEIKICNGYRYKGRLLKSLPPEITVLEQCRPEYITVKGWRRKTAGIRDFDELPAQARDYVRRISDLVKTEISIVSTGPDREETIIAPPHSSIESWVARFNSKGPAPR